jgi:sigma-B regulation protein RsbU (phosphoserine phosphatase)
VTTTRSWPRSTGQARTADKRRTGAAFAFTTIRLTAGDTLLLFTDGLTDARTGTAGGSGRYGEEAVAAFARDLAPATAAAAIAAIAALLGDLAGGLDDDTAIQALGVPAASR